MKKAALGGPSSDDTRLFCLGRKPSSKFLILLAAASYPAGIFYDLYVLIPLLEPCGAFVSWYDIYDRS